VFLNGSGAVDGLDWEDDNNWVDGLAPVQNNTHDVIIDGAIDVQITSNVVIGRLRLKNSKLTITAIGRLNIGLTNTPAVGTVYELKILIPQYIFMENYT
jgi:hypothetical protein